MKPSTALRWQLVLTVPPVPLTLVYVRGVRAGWVTPRVWPIALCGVVALVAVVFGGVAATRGDPERRGAHLMLLIVAGAEVLFTILGAMMMTLAIARQGG